MKFFWCLIRWYFIDLHRRWGVRYTFTHGWVATPDFCTEHEARKEYHRLVLRPPEDLTRVELIDSGKVIAAINISTETL